jgi:uncharacterized protein (DUF1684 family)
MVSSKKSLKFLAFLLVPVALFGEDLAYLRDIIVFRAQREATLKKQDGWLTVVGLFQLIEGDNHVGSGEGNEIELPESAPEFAGTIHFASGKSVFRPVANLGLTINGKPASETTLEPDKDMVAVGAVRFLVIKRGDGYYARVKDNESDLRYGFTGLKWFPVDPAWKFEAKFTAYERPKTILFDSQNGVKQPLESPGFVTFVKDGQEYRLDPVIEDDELFFIFRDATSNKTTYGAARFVYAAMPKNGIVTLDFNKAINPPCAFTAFATCPLPPPQNRLKLAVTAGEKKYSDKDPEE